MAHSSLSDGTLLFNSVLPHGAPFRTHRVTSLDHAVWFHRDIVPTQSMLFDQRSTAAAGGSGMNHGEFYTADGALSMTVAQESMLRRMEQQPGASAEVSGALGPCSPGRNRST